MKKQQITVFTLMKYLFYLCTFSSEQKLRVSVKRLILKSF